MSPVGKFGDKVAIAILTVHSFPESLFDSAAKQLERARKQFCDCSASAGRIRSDAFAAAQTRDNKEINPEFVHKNFTHFVAYLTLRASIISRRDYPLYLSCHYYSRKHVNNEGTFFSVNTFYR